MIMLTVVYWFCRLESIALFVRAILSWILPEDGESAIVNIIILITEPFIEFVRKTVGKAFEKIACPIDISFLITVIIFEILTVVFRSLM